LHDRGLSTAVGDEWFAPARRARKCLGIDYSGYTKSSYTTDQCAHWTGLRFVRILFERHFTITASLKVHQSQAHLG
jgi:hypothetical protein